MADASVAELFVNDPERFRRFSGEAAGLFIDYSRHIATEETLSLLLELAQAANVPEWRRRMFAGERINTTEGRAAFHVGLRASDDSPAMVDGQDMRQAIIRERDRMLAFAMAVREGRRTGVSGLPFTDVVNIGIGGSDLGPAMVTRALAPQGLTATTGPRVHFVSNVDGADLAGTLAGLRAETTLFLVASKTFTTQETITNARSARAWLARHLGEDKAPAIGRHFAALSTNAKAVEAFGIDPDAMFGFWDWVGGRYSLWSAIGLPIAIAIGEDGFRALLAGAAAMDAHFRDAPLRQNLPVLLALLGVWYANFWEAPAHAILPYDHALARLPAWVQQLEMESNGKRTDREGHPVCHHTGQVIFGEPGTNGQHAFYQLIHQGTRLIPVDFLAPAQCRHNLTHHHPILLANVLAQAQALMIGRAEGEVRARLLARGLDEAAAARLAPHMAFPGNRPSTLILFQRLTPASLGALLALYEHRTFVQGILWNINSFDQWGVELGKELAGPILEALRGGSVSGQDCATRGLIAWLQAAGVNVS